MRNYSCRLVRFGAAESADLRLTAFEGQSACQTFEINGKVTVRLPLPGRHNALNALAAIGAAMQMGLGLQQAAAEMADFTGVQMRAESIQVGSVRIINDAYNANPSSMVAAADILADQDGARRVMVAGDMRELGQDSRSLHERTGRDIALALRPHAIDLLIGVGAMGRYIASSAGAAGLAWCAFDTLEEAAAGLPAMIRPGDVVLIKGSRGMAMERLIGPLKEALTTAR
jgi:UDP-N-acetylmuramoyl-tripeptide--D-alanyl-D-alanine ligase